MPEFEQRLWLNFIKGRPEAFENLYNRYVDTLYSYGHRYTNDTELIKDSIHDLFIDLYNYRKSINPQAQVNAYLLLSFRRKLRSILKKQAIMHPDHAELSEEFSITYSIQERIIANEKQKSLTAAIEREINQLPSRQKEILYLKFNYGLEYPEIAELMKISLPTCRTLVYRAIKQLRLKLENTSVSHLLVILFG